MNEYKVELIHEPSGAYMNFVMFSETKEDEVALAKEIWAGGVTRFWAEDVRACDV